MKINKIEELNNIYEILVDNGVIFHYGSESIPYGEVTNLEFTEEDIVNIEMNGFENYEIEIEDFIENHTKTDVNYHSWEPVRRFNSLIEE